MSLYSELATSIEEVINATSESVEFKQRFSKLIENYFENNYQDNDISELIDLVHLTEDSSNGY